MAYAPDIHEDNMGVERPGDLLYTHEERGVLVQEGGPVVGFIHRRCLIGGDDVEGGFLFSPDHLPESALERDGAMGVQAVADLFHIAMKILIG